MNAYELADLIGMCGDGGYNQDAATMLRQQAKELNEAGHMIGVLREYISDLENGLDSSIKLNKAQAERQEKELTDEEILCLWDWWSGEILSTDILDFADTYKRVLLGEEGLLEWHKEYVKKMNEQYPSGKAQEK